MLLEDKVAIVSGVGPGLGQANAQALAREGATVVLAARNADYLAEIQKEIEDRGGRGTRGADQPRRSRAGRPAGAANRRRIRPARHARQQRVPHGHVRAVRRRRPHASGARSSRSTCGARSASRRRACRTLKKAAARARRRVDRVHHLDEHAQDPHARGRLLVVEGGGADRGEDDGGRARPGRRPRQLCRAGLDRRTQRRDLHRLGVRLPRHRAATRCARRSKRASRSA